MCSVIHWARLMVSETEVQDPTGASPDDAPNRIRAAALHGPLAHLRADERTEFSLIASEVSPDFLSANGEALVDVDTYLDSFGRISYATYDPLFSIRAGLDQDLSDMGLIGWALLSSENLRDGLELVAAGLRHMQSAGRFSFGIRNRRLRFEYENGFGQGAEADLDTQLSIGYLVNLVRQTQGHENANLIVRFPGCTPAHKNLFPEAQVVTDAPIGIVEFDADLLWHPLKHSNTALHATLSRAILADFGDVPELCDIVRELQIAAIYEAQGPVSLDVMSKLLGLSERRLQHELQLCGCSFADIRNQVRFRAAKGFLKSGISVAETAARLGYAHQQTFSNAFQRWEGVAPTVYASRGG